MITLEKAFANCGPFPTDSLFLGIAKDGGPVLLDLADSELGPILVISDEPNDFLRVVAAGVVLSKAKNVQSVCDTDGRLALPTATWAYWKNSKFKFAVYFLDNLEKVSGFDSEYQKGIKWLLKKGPGHGVWPIFSLNSSAFETAGEWLEFFECRIYGRPNREFVFLGNDMSMTFVSPTI